MNAASLFRVERLHRIHSPVSSLALRSALRRSKFARNASSIFFLSARASAAFCWLFSFFAVRSSAVTGALSRYSNSDMQDNHPNRRLFQRAPSCFCKPIKGPRASPRKNWCRTFPSACRPLDRALDLHKTLRFGSRTTQRVRRLPVQAISNSPCLLARHF
jgi:hypothetical protein